MNKLIKDLIYQSTNVTGDYHLPVHYVLDGEKLVQLVINQCIATIRQTAIDKEFEYKGNPAPAWDYEMAIKKQFE